MPKQLHNNKLHSSGYELKSYKFVPKNQLVKNSFKDQNLKAINEDFINQCNINVSNETQNVQETKTLIDPNQASINSITPCVFNLSSTNQENLNYSKDLSTFDKIFIQLLTKCNASYLDASSETCEIAYFLMLAKCLKYDFFLQAKLLKCIENGDYISDLAIKSKLTNPEIEILFRLSFRLEDIEKIGLFSGQKAKLKILNLKKLANLPDSEWKHVKINLKIAIESL